MTYTKPIMLVKLDNDTRDWENVGLFHAAINKTGGSEYLSSGAVQSKVTLVFEVRYCAEVADIYLNTQLYRIRYNGVEYDIEDYDDFHEQHRSVKLLGVARGV